MDQILLNKVHGPDTPEQITWTRYSQINYMDQILLNKLHGLDTPE